MKASQAYRTFWRRVWAAQVDSLLFSPLVALGMWLQFRGGSPGARVFAFALCVAAEPAYQIYMHGRFGQTVGKRLFRVKVLDLSGAPLTMLQALRRGSVDLVLALWALVAGAFFILHGGNPYDWRAALPYGLPAGMSLTWSWLEVGCALYSRKRRAIHDLLARSVVIRLDGATARPRRDDTRDVPTLIVPS